MDDKPLLRRRLRAARNRRDGDELERLGALIAEVGAARARDATLVAAYAAVGTEPPTRLLVERLVTAGCSVVLPVVRGPGLAWARYDGWEALADRGGLLEPVGEATHDIAEADVVFTPALAVDRTGVRLGRGGGHYDRALVGVPRHRLVAVVFGDEVVDVLPREPHDVRVGAAVTPEGLVEL